MICKKCNKDHKVKNTGVLTVCETIEYFKHGSFGHHNGKKAIGFGIGQNRFQFNEAK